MSWALQAAEARIHLWPWSVEIPQETHDLTGGHVSFPFRGSPVISLAVEAELRLPARMERFTPLGAAYPYSNPTYWVYETPHGVLAGPTNSLRLRTRQGSQEIRLTCEGAAEGLHPFDGTAQIVDSELAMHVRAWSQAFDDLLERARQLRGRSTELQWIEVLGELKKISEPSEPRMALIVHIAEQMRRHLPENVSRARRILLRQRELVPLDRLQETDRACLRWYVRQPGRTASEKSGPRQRLLGVVRAGSFDTLENQVLKDFIVRCQREASRYLEGEIGDSPQMNRSRRAQEVRSYKNVCITCLANPILEHVSLPTSGVQPNYVLQHDLRYRKVWQFYKRLLKHEKEKDKIWDWQPRTWADVMRLFVGAALELGRRLPKERRMVQQGVILEALVSSRLQVRPEQVLGSRIVPGSEPGPFLLTRVRRGHPETRGVLELIHPDLAALHPVANLLGRTGGHLYLVLHPLGGSHSRTKVLILWSVNGAGVTRALDLDEMAHSGLAALQNHYTVLSQRRSGFPDLKGMIVVSQLEGTSATFHQGHERRLPVLEASADPRGWESAVQELASGFEIIFEEML